MKKIVSKKNVLMLLVLIVIIAGAVVLNGLTGETVTAKSKDFEVTSTLEMEETNINSQMSGQIQQIKVKEGDAVITGQILAIVNSDTINAQKQKAEGSITTIQGQILSAQTSMELAKTNFDRMTQLYSSGAISKSAYDSAKAQYDVANASLVTLQGQMESAEAAVAEVNTYLSKTEIIAPTDGIITEVNVENGELVSSGLPIAVITDTSKPWIICNVMEDDLSKVALNQNVEVKFQAYPNKIFQGKVTKINKSADFAVKRATNSNGEFDVLSFGARVDLSEADQRLYAGMSVVVNFGVDSKNITGEN